MLRWSVAIVALITCRAAATEGFFSLESAWSLMPGSRPYLTSSGSLERGLAYNPLTDHVLLVSRLDNATLRSVNVFAAGDGAVVGQLNASGISGGTLVLNKLGVADDGAIYAANAVGYAAGNPFKIYRWSSEAVAPTVAFSGDPGQGVPLEWGHAMDVRGTGGNTQILVASGGTNVALFTTAAGTSYSATRLNTDAPTNAFVHGLAFGAGNTFWGKAHDGLLRWLRFDRATGTATTLRTFSAAEFPANIGSIAVDCVNQLLAGLAIETPLTVQLYDISNPTNPPVFLASRPLGAENENDLFQGALDFYHGGRLFALAANNGVGAFRVAPAWGLGIARTGGQVALDWPRRLGPAVVQSRTQTVAGSWVNRTNQPAAQGEQMQVSLPRANGTEFFRVQRTLRLMSYNIHHGEGVDGVIDLARIATVITNAGADLVGLQEVDRNTTRSGGVDQAAELARLTGMNFFFGKNITYQGGEYGVAVLSRFPIRQQTHTLLTRIDTSVEQRGVNRVVVDLGGAPLVFLNTHLDAGSGDTERTNSVAQLKTIAAGYGSLPVIVCGDFNATPGSAPYGLMATDFIDAWPGVGAGNGFTFSSTVPNRRIDYFWVRPNPGLSRLRSWVPATTASDHLPLVLECLWPPP